MNLIAPRVFCVGTHHKTGTLWMRIVFRNLSRAIGVENRLIWSGSGAGIIPAAERIFLCQWSSKFPADVTGRPDARILHLIRDPRDVLLSGMRYHRHAGPAGEAFLHEPRADLGGSTYQQHLDALEDETGRLMFEMGEKHAETLDEMLTWTPARNTIEARYEALIGPRGAEIFRDHLRDLGLTEPEVATGVRVFLNNSLSDGLADDGQRPDRVKAHVSSGAPGQWRTELPHAVARAYAERYGPALVALGYETHPTAWLEELRDAA